MAIYHGDHRYPSEHAYGPDYGQHPIGSGRYIMKQWDKGQQVIFEANPDYYGKLRK
ncbi:MAG: ABC transporter substrate-binding protein [Clostridium sp.]